MYVKREMFENDGAVLFLSRAESGENATSSNFYCKV
jgi:hypothetical protein